MIPRFPIHFFLADEKAPVLPGAPLWEAPLPMDRGDFPRGPFRKQDSPCYADYFSAAEDFLARDGGRLLGDALSLHLGRPVSAGQITGARVFLEKHGAFYHPARVRIDIGDRSLFMVLNAALSAQGAGTIGGEYDLLERLGKRPGPSFLPRAFAFGFGRDRSGRRIPMFLGEWLEGYFEFHVSADGSRLWDPDGSRRLSRGQTLEIHRQTSRILTHYYDISTGARIHPWHHAAGDFVARVDASGVDLRLITVRGYRPVFSQGEADPAAMIRTLVVFFLDLSFRMRLDRIDGVGDLVWMGAPVVEPALLGALEALSQVPDPPGFPAPAADLFLAALAGMTDHELRDTSGVLAGTADPGCAALIRGHLDEHLQELRHTLENLMGGIQNA